MCGMLTCGKQQVSIQADGGGHQGDKCNNWNKGTIIGVKRCYPFFCDVLSSSCTTLNAASSCQRLTLDLREIEEACQKVNTVAAPNHCKVSLIIAAYFTMQWVHKTKALNKPWMRIELSVARSVRQMMNSNISVNPNATNIHSRTVVCLKHNYEPLIDTRCIHSDTRPIGKLGMIESHRPPAIRTQETVQEQDFTVEPTIRAASRTISCSNRICKHTALFDACHVPAVEQKIAVRFLVKEKAASAVHAQVLFISLIVPLIRRTIDKPSDANLLLEYEVVI